MPDTCWMLGTDHIAVISTPHASRPPPVTSVAGIAQGGPTVRPLSGRCASGSCALFAAASQSAPAADTGKTACWLAWTAHCMRPRDDHGPGHGPGHGIASLGSSTIHPSLSSRCCEAPPSSGNCAVLKYHARLLALCPSALLPSLHAPHTPPPPTPPPPPFLLGSCNIKHTPASQPNTQTNTLPSRSIPSHPRPPQAPSMTSVPPSQQQWASVIHVSCSRPCPAPRTIPCLSAHHAPASRPTALCPPLLRCHQLTCQRPPPGSHDSCR